MFDITRVLKKINLPAKDKFCNLQSLRSFSVFKIGFMKFYWFSYELFIVSVIDSSNFNCIGHQINIFHATECLEMIMFFKKQNRKHK